MIAMKLWLIKEVVLESYLLYLARYQHLNIDFYLFTEPYYLQILFVQTYLN